MNIRPLIIDDEILAEAEAIVRYATAHPVTIRKVVRMASKSEPPVGDSKEHVLMVQVGYRCVFSIEEQPVGKCRHLSVSVPEKGKAPNERAVLEVMKLFGFKATKFGPEVMAWLEDIAEDFKAVNVLERSNGEK
jgi:hypothetical protein